MIDKVIKAMEEERGILGVNITGLEHIGTNPKNSLTCRVYEDYGLFVPHMMYEVELTEEEVINVINHFKGLWVLTDSNYTTKETFRYFAVEEPNSLKWVNSSKG